MWRDDILNKITDDELKNSVHITNGVRIMSIEARYLYKMQESETGYDSSLHWNVKKDILPRKLYKVVIPYSLGLIHWFNMEQSAFDKIGKQIYSNDIINVTFNRAAKTKAKDKNGSVKYKPRIKENKRGRYSLEVVEELETEKGINDLKDELYNGFILDNEKYVQFMRTPGKARTGAILFIKEKLLKDFLLWARMDIDFDNITDRVDVAGLKASESLIFSEIKDVITIKSNEILLIPDVKIPFIIPRGKASITEMGQDGMAVTYDNEEEVERENDIFDGQSLLVPEYFHGGKSMNLLRNRFFKTAAFCFDIQKWFKDNDITDISQLNGYTLADNIGDIKLITTPNSIKFMKLKKYITFKEKTDDTDYAAYVYWLKHIEEDNCIFGIVKNEYASGFIKGYNYQVDNSLELNKDELRELLQYEFKRIQKAKDDNDYFVNEFLEKGKEDLEHDKIFRKQKFDNCVYELYKLNSDIQYTKFFRDYKNNMLGTDYKDVLKQGKYKLEDSDYCVVCSNPFEMIQHACGVKVDDWQRVHYGREAFCRYYSDGQDLIATRSPHIYSGNVICLHNTYHNWIDEYMKVSDNIVIINSIESDIMDRANGMDFDSDTLLLSSNHILVEKAKYCEEKFPTPICQIVPTEKERYYCMEDFIDCDKTIADAKIGEIVDLSQLLQSYYHDVRLNKDIDDRKKQKVLLYLRNEISKLASLSGCEIDRAKREFPVDTDKELNRIRNYMAGHEEPDNLFNGIIKTGGVEYVADTVKKKYLKEGADIKEEEKEDFEIIQKVLLLNEKNSMISKALNDDLMNEYNAQHIKEMAENNKEISRLLKSRKKYRDNVSAKPMFFKEVFPENDATYYEYFNTAMDYLQEILKEEYPRKQGRDDRTFGFMDFFAKPIEYNKKGKLKKGNDKHAKELIKIAERYEKNRKELYANYAKANGLEYDAEKERRELFKQAVEEVSEIKLTKQTVYLMLNKLYGSNQAKSHDGGAGELRKTILDILYNSKKKLLLEMFSVRKTVTEEKVS